MRELPVKSEEADDLTEDAAFRAMKILILLFWIICTIRSACAQVSEPASQLRVVFYNVENLFDTADDSTVDDDDFLPSGEMKWSSGRFRQKINSLYKVLVAAGNPEPPAVAGLCEVENRAVLEALIYDTYLSEYRYGIVHYDSDDERGIDVAILYRREILRLQESRYLIPGGYKTGEFRSRGILYAKFVAGTDTLHLFMNHWPSRRGGVLRGEGDRTGLAGRLKAFTDSLAGNSGSIPGIVIGGDFNCLPHDPAMELLLDGGAGDRPGNSSLINLSAEKSSGGEGTYKFRGIWEMFDQVIVSRPLLDAENGFVISATGFQVFRSDFLLTRDEYYPGLRPFSTYSGYRYQGGFSDHLPVILDLELRKDVRLP